MGIEQAWRYHHRDKVPQTVGGDSEIREGNLGICAFNENLGCEKDSAK